MRVFKLLLKTTGTSVIEFQLHIRPEQIEEVIAGEKHTRETTVFLTQRLLDAKTSCVQRIFDQIICIRKRLFVDRRRPLSEDRQAHAAMQGAVLDMMVTSESPRSFRDRVVSFVLYCRRSSEGD